ncbi:packaging glycoprotein [Acidovorax sp. SUPP1855]|uniref:portal protein n=1 Tax=Acidovorax sp. SUPP1855 TaxID=431774 RepID=UPI0023DE6A6D|nr:portal protein [Acidovorax sp. SUPP1855]GKS86485.1 packaging glycoprotein [Acidovorax sp. SUPP1855]
MTKKDDDLYAQAMKDFEACISSESDNRREALEDLRFARLAQQWPVEVEEQRRQEGRPCLTINRLPTYIRQVVNDARLNKPSIHCHPVDDGGDVKTAEVLNGLIRNIEVISGADIAYDTAIESAVSGGFGYIRVVTDYARDDNFDLDILIKRVANPFTVYGDPDAEAGDGSDWNRAFVTEWMKEPEFKRRWPNADVQGWKDGTTGDDRHEWIDDDRIRVAEYWTRVEVDKTIVRLSTGEVWDKKDYEEREEMFLAQGITVTAERQTKAYKVTQHWIGGGEVLESKEWAGKYIPIIPVYGDEVNIEGKKHWISLIRFAKDPQRMLNYWRTASTELVALAPKTPYVGAAGSFDTDSAKWATANTETHPYIEYDLVEGAAPPQRQPFAGPPAGALQEALSASDDIKSVIGLHDASLGARSNETSGRAIIARQREGDVSTFHFLDNMTRAIRQTGRILVDLIPKVYDSPRVLRVLGEDMKPTTVQVNQAIPQSDGSELIYDLQNGKYDVTVKAGPSFTTQREEFVASVTELTRAFPPAAPILMDMLVKAQDWPEADKIAARLKTLLPPQIQAMENGEQPIPPQAQQQMQQMQQQLQAGAQQFAQLQEAHQKSQQENQKAQFEAMKAQADRDIKLADLEIKARDVEIARINAGSKQQELQSKIFESQNQQVYNPATAEVAQ